MIKIKIAGAFIFLLSILLVFLFNDINKQNNLNNDTLNNIKQQKIFIQDISKNILFAYKDKNISNYKLDNSIKKLLLNISAIKNQNNKTLSLYSDFYLKIQEFKNLNKITTSYSSILIEKLVNNIYKTNLELIIELDKLISIHQKELQNKLNIYKNIEYTLFFLLITLLVYLFTQIKKILIFVQRFLLISKKMIKNSSIKNLEPLKEDSISSNISLYDATNNFNSFVHKTNASVEYSIKSIEHSSKSLEMVENNLEDVLKFLYTMENNDMDLTKKEDVIIQSLEELITTTQNLKNLKNDLNDLINFKS